jgi:pyruvate kinase
MSPADVARHAEIALRETPDLACIIDLQGAKMRLGFFDAREVHAGQELGFSESAVCEGADLPLPHPELYTAVSPGEVLTIDDGKLEVAVERIEPKRLSVRVVRGGWIRPRKGINRQTHPIDPGSLCETDRAVIRACRHLDGIEYAISFISDGREAEWVRALTPSRVILKIERDESIRSLLTTSARSDEVWICRGDLGAQLGLNAMARAVHDIDPGDLDVPVLLAGQVLEHLTHEVEPTRSEVCHLYDVIARGFSGIVLSDETAIGINPENAVRWAARLLREL